MCYCIYSRRHQWFLIEVQCLQNLQNNNRFSLSSIRNFCVNRIAEIVKTPNHNVFGIHTLISVSNRTSWLAHALLHSHTHFVEGTIKILARYLLVWFNLHINQISLLGVKCRKSIFMTNTKLFWKVFNNLRGKMCEYSTK